MLLCSQDRSIQCIWHVFKDKHAKSFVYSPACSLAYWSSKVTVSDWCKFSFEFLFFITVYLPKLSGREKKQKQEYYIHKDAYSIRKFTSSILLKLPINNKYCPKYSPKSLDCANLKVSKQESTTQSVSSNLPEMKTCLLLKTKSRVNMFRLWDKMQGHL